MASQGVGVDASFPAESRIRKRADFLRVQRGSTFSVRSATFLMLLAPAPPGVACPRLGLVVGRKFGNSPTRARFKRLAREWFRQHKDWFPGPIDVVLLARGAAPSKRLETLHAELMQCEQRTRRGACDVFAKRLNAEARPHI